MCVHINILFYNLITYPHTIICFSLSHIKSNFKPLGIDSLEAHMQWNTNQNPLWICLPKKKKKKILYEYGLLHVQCLCAPSFIFFFLIPIILQHLFSFQTSYYIFITKNYDIKKWNAIYFYFFRTKKKQASTRKILKKWNRNLHETPQEDRIIE